MDDIYRICNIKPHAINLLVSRFIDTDNTMKEKTNELKFVAATKANNASTNINIVKGGNTTNSVTNQSAITTADAAINHSDTTSSDLLSQVS